ncbi:lipase family protein [Limnobacter parvus]|uniref:Lipase family protein n=1 Tax=Limnobacter parvus TaxID=2939690 RepID=A0ABT1XH28_9BURK|nr:lipase family protein [Limnobacter parvus]MCR2745399.1 lipase family protein [Limnobacter parvus]
MTKLLLQPNYVHALSDFVYEADEVFRKLKAANPTATVAHVSTLSSDELLRVAKTRKLAVESGGFGTLAGKSGLFNIDLLSGFGFVAHGTGSRANELILVTRGTNFSHNKFDLGTNANIGYGVGPRGNLFHRGFLKTFKSYQSQLVNFVSQNGTKRPTTIHCMGHSLGGALANLNACMLRDAGFNVCLYTIGAPRVGIVSYAQDLTRQISPDQIRRIANPCDPVPMVPVFPYAHASRAPSELLVQHGEKVGIDAHLLHSGYSKMAHSSSWSDFAPMPNVLSSHADLANDFARIGGGSMFNTKLLELIGKLTRRVLLDMGYVYLVTTQGALSVAFTAVDLLAELLIKAFNHTKLLAEDVFTIVNSMLGFLGRAQMQGSEITLNTLRWILNQFSVEMAGRSEQALLKAQKRN